MLISPKPGINVFTDNQKNWIVSQLRKGFELLPTSDLNVVYLFVVKQNWRRKSKNTHQPDPLQPKSGPSIVAPCPGCSCQCPGHHKGMVGGGRGLQKGWLMFKGIVTQFVFFQLNLIFWIVMVVWYCSFWGVYKPPKLDNSDVEVCPHGPQITAHCAAAFRVPLRRNSRFWQ